VRLPLAIDYFRFAARRTALKNPPAPSPAVQFKTAGRRERSRRQQQGRDDVPSRRESATRHPQCARVGYIGEGAFVVREHGISASPMVASLGTFLAETRKVRYFSPFVSHSATMTALTPPTSLPTIMAGSISGANPAVKPR